MPISEGYNLQLDEPHARLPILGKCQLIELVLMDFGDPYLFVQSHRFSKSLEYV